MAAEQQMTAEQAEAYGVGRSLGVIETTLGHLLGTVGKIEKTTDGTSHDVTEIKVTLAQHAGEIRGTRSDVDELKLRDSPSRSEHNELRAEVAASRLTWGKLLAGVGTLGALIVAGLGLLLNYANSLGLFR